MTPQTFTFDDVVVGGILSYRASDGALKVGRVIRKQQKLVTHWRKPEEIRQSVVVEVNGQRVSLTQMKNVRAIL